jgi:hypothetical protein
MVVALRWANSPSMEFYWQSVRLRNRGGAKSFTGDLCSKKKERKKERSKAIPVTGRGDLEGCEMLRIRDCVDNRLTDGGNFVSLTHNFSASDTHFC